MPARTKNGPKAVLPYRIAALAILALLVFALGDLVNRLANPTVKWAVVAVLTALIGLSVLRRWRAQKVCASLLSAAEKMRGRAPDSELVQTCDKAVEIARKNGLLASDSAVRILLLRSEAQRKMGKREDALQSSIQALAAFCKLKNGAIQLATLDQAGFMLLEMNLERRAIPLLEGAAALGQLAGQKPLQAAIRFERMGMAFLRVGLHAKSVGAFAKAVEMMAKERGPDAPALANLHINLGNGYKRMQKFEDAERCYREALRIRQSSASEDPEQLTIPLLNLGVVCAETGREEEAEKYYQEVLELRVRKLGRNHWRVGNTYNNLAGCRRRLRDFNGAERYIQQAIEILESRPESLTHAMESLSRLREDEGRLEEALAATARAREIQQNMTTPDLSEMATLYEREAQLASRCGDEERSGDCRSRAAQIRQALASATSDGDATNLPESLKLLDQHLTASVQRVKALQSAM